MSELIAPGTPVPDFTLKREDGSDFTAADLEGRTTVLVFYPNAFSPVCTDQLQVYDEALEELHERGAVMYAVSTDHTNSQVAFREKLGVRIGQLSDFHPKGATAQAFGVWFEPAGFATRALVVVGPDRVVKWSWIGEHPGVLPGVNLVFDGLQAASA